MEQYSGNKKSAKKTSRRQFPVKLDMISIQSETLLTQSPKEQSVKLYKQSIQLIGNQLLEFPLIVIDDNGQRPAVANGY